MENKAKFGDNSKIPFGKYKGTPMISVPASYLLWLHESGCNQSNVRVYIRDNIDAIKKEAKEGK